MVSKEQFAADDAWRAPLSPGSKLQVSQVTPASDGLRIALPNNNGNDVAIEALVGDYPASLPTVIGDQVTPSSGLIATDSTMVNLATADQVGQVPRFGRVGTLMDLDYANRSAPNGRVAYSPEVWLGRNAPADAVERLRQQGLVIQGVRELNQQRAALDNQGPAVAVRFHELGAGFAIILAAGALWLVAGVERRRRAGEIGALAGPGRVPPGRQRVRVSGHGRRRGRRRARGRPGRLAAGRRPDPDLRYPGHHDRRAALAPDPGPGPSLVDSRGGARGDGGVG